MSNKIEIITTCVGRSSFLRETLQHNKSKVDNVIVVTSPTDYETHRICNGEGAVCVQTDLFYKYNAPFDKGRALNEGVKKLQHNEWVLLTDCDILLLPAHKNFLRDPKLNKELMFGCRRIILETRSKYLSFIKKIAFNPQEVDVNKLINDDPKEIGVGFFQLFNISSNRAQEILNEELNHDDQSYHGLVQPLVNDLNYPWCYKNKRDLHPYFPTAGGSDSQFRHFYADKNLVAVSPIPVIHLGSIGRGHGGAERNFE